MQLRYRDFEKILNIGIRLSVEKDRNHLLAAILDAAMEITNCDASTLYLYEDEGLSFKLMKTISLGISRGEDGKPIDDLPPVPMKEENVCAYTALHREIVNIPDVYDSSQFDFSGPREYDNMTGYCTKSQLVVPLENNENELIGVLQLINAMDSEGKVIAFDKEYEIIIRSLGSITAIELTNLSYVEELKEQLYSFVEALTTALDERTPYNARHTRNVEKYAGILADYIAKLHREGKCEEDFGPERKEKLMLAALLHDIGKMVVPLNVMNKATRLGEEIEKVDERFKLLRALYEIDMLKGRMTQEEYEETVKELQEELEFIHRTDVAEYLDDTAYEQVCLLAEKRHVGEDGTVTSYLTDKEVQGLKIRRGTLTEQERREMENHVVMTAKILNKVQFHKGYSKVPGWVASHHELMDGSGYPNHLTGKDLELETRILTVVDIYDALVATDRPYKKPISRETTIEMLREQAAKGKIDGRLVEWLSEALKEYEDKRQ